uniref:condensation domain-containing protein n=1 Tax=uncultured Methanobrevibacter sp. TaxID=253161 RepID=UPI0025F1EFAA
NNFIDYYVNKYDMHNDSTFGLFSSIGFDVGAIRSICAPIYVGASLDIIPNDIRLNIDKLNKHFIDKGVTHTTLPTQVARMFINEIESTSLKVLNTGGEKLGDIVYATDYSFIDSYGPTECCVSVCDIEVKDKMDSSSIGHLFTNTKGYILDNENRRVPIGAVGELCIAGKQTADGYLNRPKETAASFVKNPFDSNEEYGVMYRTGDLVRILEDGTFAIVGRRDSQVKIRGNRVELGEVESVIMNIDLVENVTVQTADNNGNNELVAYVVVSDDEFEGNLRELVCDYVAKRKPDYMIPSYVVRLDEVPLTVNGKVDKNALPEVDFNDLHVEYIAPTNESEKAIVNAFEVVFNQKDISLYDDFVHLGGDSITAIRVVLLLEKNSISCSAKDILNYKTPYLIAQHVNENIEITSYDVVEGSVDLLPIQKYFFDQINLNNFTQQFVLKFKTDMNIDILQKSFDELTKIHDMLRAVYRVDGDNVVQEVLPLNTKVCITNEHIVEDNLDENMMRVFVKSTESINIESKLMDVNLIRYDDESYLMLVIHHLIVDGVSWNILLSDLTDIYYKLLKGESVDLLRPYNYKLWANDVKCLVESISDNEKQYWIELNNLLNDSLIKGQEKKYSFNVDIEYDASNLLMLSEEEYWALAISRAYKKTYGEDIIFNHESHGRDESIANINRR